MNSIFKLLLSQFLFLLLFSCSNEYQIVSNKHKVIEVKNEQDSTIIDIIRPYKTQLDKEMNQIICYTKSELKKGKPESKLGNFVCDRS